MTNVAVAAVYCTDNLISPATQQWAYAGPRNYGCETKIIPIVDFLPAIFRFDLEHDWKNWKEGYKRRQQRL